MSYFWNPPGAKIGVKADIERHRSKQEELERYIKDMEERLLSDPDDCMAREALRTYRHILAILLQSKAETVNKLGRK